MRKFYVLLKKEIRELLTPQIFAPMLVMVLVFVFIGKVLDSENKRTGGTQRIAVIDQDNSSLSSRALERLTAENFLVERYTGADLNSLISQTKDTTGRAYAYAYARSILIIPRGFEDELMNCAQQNLEAYSVIKDFSVSAAFSSGVLKEATAVIEDFVITELIERDLPMVSTEILKNPLTVNDHVIINNRSAAIDPEAVMAFVTSQTTYIPIVLFLVIIFAAQIIVTAIANEKEHKTLETLLTVPINRSALVAAKMVAAGLMALVIALIYLLGFRYYMHGVTGGVGGGEFLDDRLINALYGLGLVLKPVDYVLQGLSIFLGILSALAIAFVLGSLAEDIKSAQGLITPLVFLVMVPYFLVLFLDLNAISPVIKTILYAIPFTHPFMAAPNLLLNDYHTVIWGIVYETCFFMVFVFIATKLFASDRVLTMKLRLRRRS